MKYKNVVYTFIAVFFIPSLIFFSVILYYDPLKLFHKPWVYKKYLQSNMREQASGIINHWNFDSLILGTSMLENTSSKEASNILGGKFVNISSSGSDYFERSIFLKYAIEKKKEIKKVIYSLDNLGWVRKGNPSIKVESWDYLYDTNKFNDFKIYINNKYLTCLFSLSSKKTCMGFELDFDRPKAWYKFEHQAIKYGGFDKWLNSDDPQIKRAFKTILDTIKKIKSGNLQSDKKVASKITVSQQYLDKYILDIVQKNPNIEFIFLLPPYSRIKMATLAQHRKGDFLIFKGSLKYLALQTSKYKNFKLFGWGNKQFVDKIENYGDLKHYEYKINSWMLGAIHRNEGLLSVDNIDYYLDTISEKALNYDLFSLGNKIKKFQTSKNKK